MVEMIRSYETSGITRATRRRTPEDGILPILSFTHIVSEEHGYTLAVKNVHFDIYYV
jgi:hypothetical protein